MNFLRQCSKIADKVIVSLNTDEFIEYYKGKPPIMTYEERKKSLEFCKFVDEVDQRIPMPYRYGYTSEQE
jgi:cytidyltransferase-like protein